MRRVLALWCAVVLAGLVPVGSALAATTAAKTSTESATVTSSSSGTSSVPLQEPGTTNPFSPGVPESSAGVATTTTATPTVAATTTTSSDSGLSGTSVIVIALGAIILIGGISFFIGRDARRNARALAGSHANVVEGTGHKAGSKKPPKPRKPSAAERRRRKRGRAPRRK